MLSAVHFDDQSSFQTHEINDVIAQRLLSSEFVTFELPETEMTPKQAFNFGRILPQYSGLRPNLIHTPYPFLSPQGGKESHQSKHPNSITRSRFSTRSSRHPTLVFFSPPPSVNCSLTKLIAPSASARCSPGLAPPLG